MGMKWHWWSFVLRLVNSPPVRCIRRDAPGEAFPQRRVRLGRRQASPVLRRARSALITRKAALRTYITGWNPRSLPRKSVTAVTMFTEHDTSDGSRDNGASMLAGFWGQIHLLCARPSRFGREKVRTNAVARFARFQHQHTLGVSIAWWRSIQVGAVDTRLH